MAWDLHRAGTGETAKQMSKSKRKASKKVRRHPIVSNLVGLFSIGVIKLAGLFPYRWRVPASGWVMSTILAPILGYRTRIRKNLSMIFPQMPQAEKEELARKVPRQIGRTLMEMFSPSDLKRVAASAELMGAGVDHVMSAKIEGKPIVFVSGHMGNYDVSRAAMIQRGFEVGALFRNMNNARFNAFYVSKIEEVGKPLFARGRRGLAEMVKFLRQGKAVAIMVDQHVTAGEPLTFFGHTAYTALSAAEMALKYNALLVPIYTIRQPDGLSFKIILEAPVEHSTPEEMTQKLNDSLEAQVRAHMDQWFWIHRRWKPVKKRR